MAANHLDEIKRNLENVARDSRYLVIDLDREAFEAAEKDLDQMEKALADTKRRVGFLKARAERAAQPRAVLPTKAGA